jgi:DnaK suppressor protein
MGAVPTSRPTHSPVASPLVVRYEAEQSAIAVLVGDLEQELAAIIGGAADDQPDDEHDVEGSSIGFERARVTALLRSTEARQQLIDDALVDARAGIGAACRVCGTPIPAERLAALSGVNTCIACSATSIRPRYGLAR